MILIKPSCLKRGDKVAIVSLSWGGAGDINILWRYNIGKKRLEEEFGLEVIEMPHTLSGTEVWPCSESWDNAIIFFETSEEKPEPRYVKYWLRNYGCQGILQKVKGLIFGKPYDDLYYEEYKKVILKVVREELKLVDLPILYNMNFGHTAPMITIPYGAMAEINCDNKTFCILESGVN